MLERKENILKEARSRFEDDQFFDYFENSDIIFESLKDSICSYLKEYSELEFLDEDYHITLTNLDKYFSIYDEKEKLAIYVYRISGKPFKNKSIEKHKRTVHLDSPTEVLNWILRYIENPFE